VITKGIVIIINTVLIGTTAFSQWNKIYDEIPLSEGAFNCLEITTDSSMFYGTGKHIFKSSTLGYTWDEVYDAGAVSIDCVGNDTCYCAGYYSEIGSGGVALRTYDSGATWQLPVSFPLYWASNFDVFTLNGSQVFICGGDGYGYVQTTDDGFDNVIITIPNISAQSIGAVSCVNSDTCICVTGSPMDDIGEDYKIYKTINGGESWTENITAQYGRDIVHINENLVFILERLALIKSIDGGETWDTIKEFTPIPGSHFVTMKFVDENNGYLAEQFDIQDSIAIYKTQNGGGDWIETTINDMPIGIYDIDCLTKDHCFFIGGLGEIYNTTNGGIGTTISNVGISLITISPNPAIDYITLSISKNTPIDNVYSYNLYGQKVKVAFDASGFADISSLNSGVYFTLVSTSTGSQVVKWVKQ